MKKIHHINLFALACDQVCTMGTAFHTLQSDRTIFSTLMLQVYREKQFIFKLHT